MTSFTGVIMAILLGTFLLMLPSFRPVPSPFDRREDRGGLTEVFKRAP